ncbi:bifunctional GNAT family N-acetyltransferase/acetate--CoA ligase family protein [Streptomyces sp. 891-h]|uniref:bifunctional acetate--CoA ligase family protein/GNAT family N-acetyltransferase n=1 Tax=Streptomyces sp. 891-h TaxID=2720714 RepID=UPI001FAA6458|nr:bifunctional GNAT family N-acetyltransferase/acetate--CoA ligase family protein [Streptomyces sp. 891-h]UNZ16980.1 GNAT family N-acetyltransferase [Streptomyces sp. 891-h]
MPSPEERAYPAHWEADIVLRDGGTARVRPITPDDAERLVSFYEQVSDESKYYRFFAPYPRLSDRDVRRFTHHDYVDRVGLAATIGGEFIATVRYDRIDEFGRPAGEPADEAEVAFLVRDDQQGRGVASALLEHIGAVARERGIRRFAAEVMPANTKMIKVFTDAGYSQKRSFEDGSVHLTLDLEPTERSLAVMRAREQRAEARSVARLLAPGSVAVVGVSRTPGGAGRAVLGSLLTGGFPGRLYAVNHALDPGATSDMPAGVPGYRSVREIPEHVDLAVLAVPADQLHTVIGDCGEAAVQGLAVLSEGVGRDEQRELVRLARSYGMRLIGPGALGLINTADDVRLNATPSLRMPARGRIGVFTQSGAIGIALLDGLDRRGVGPSSFVSAGNRADVSGNDLLQHWDEDAATDVVLMYLESIGNPRKFTRLARRTAARKPVVVVKGARQRGSAPPPGHAAPASRTPDATVYALLRQAGVLMVDTFTELLDTGVLLAEQPPPAGPHVGILGNTDAMSLLTYDACLTDGLRPRPVVALPTSAAPDDFGRALREALIDAATDAVLVTVIPTVPTQLPGTSGATGATTDPAPPQSPPDGHVEALADALREAVEAVATTEGAQRKPVAVVHLAMEGLQKALARRGLPSYPTPERASRALSEAVRYSRWRAEAGDPGKVPDLDIDESAAADLLARFTPPAPGRGRALTDEETAHLLRCYGIAVQPTLAAPDAEAAVAAARTLGFPVALKTTAPHLRHRADLGGVRLDIAGEAGLRRAYGELTEALGAPEELRPVVQSMAPRGVGTVVRGTLDPAIGAVLSFGLAGAPSELLGDTAHRLVPVTDKEAAGLVRAIRSAPLLFGWRGAEPSDTAALEEVLLRVSLLMDDHPQVVAVELDPVVVAPRGVTVLDAAVRVADPGTRPDLGARRLPAY